MNDRLARRPAFPWFGRPNGRLHDNRGFVRAGQKSLLGTRVEIVVHNGDFDGRLQQLYRAAKVSSLGP